MFNVWQLLDRPPTAHCLLLLLHVIISTVDKPLTPQQELEQVLTQEQALADAGQPPEPELILRRAELLNELRRFSESLAACEELQAIPGKSDSRESALMQVLLAGNFNQLRRLEESLAASDRAEQICLEQGLPLDPRIASSRGLAFTQLGRREEALAALADSERLFIEQGLPVGPGIAVNRGSVFYHLGRYEEALAAFAEAERLFIEQGMPVFPGIAVSRGRVFQKLGRYEEALDAFAESERQYNEQALPVWPGIYTNRAAVFGKLGRYEEALAAYAESERMQQEQGTGEDWSLYFNRAITMYEAGHRDEAIKEVYRAIALCGKIGAEQPGFVIETLQDWMSPKPEKIVAEQIASQPVAIAPIPDSEKRHDVFICYRREPGLSNSMLLQAHMNMNSRTVFRDQDGLSSGRFEEDLREAIRYSRHMVILMTADFFSRCSDDKDVVRKEIATALHHGTHIIPVMMEGFNWPAEEELPEDIRGITGINAMSWSTEFFTAFIDKLLRWMGE